VFLLALAISILIQTSCYAAPQLKTVFPHLTELETPQLDPKDYELNFNQTIADINRERMIKLMDGASCAVVGSSSNLLGSNYGEEIDDHDVVIRNNGAPVKVKYANDVGLKTTVRFLNNPGIKYEDGTRNMDPNSFLVIRRKRPKVIKVFEQHPDNIVLYSYKNMDTILGDLGIPNLSSGLKSLALALSLCGEIDVYGFGEDINGELAYYYKDTKFDYEPHKADIQRDFIFKLAKEKIVKVHMGNAEIKVPRYTSLKFHNQPVLKEEYIKYKLETRKNFIKTIENKSCAVVGSSSNVLGSNYGEFIDSHDVVFRVNDAPVEEKYSKDIGEKTTVRFLNGHMVKYDHHNYNIEPGSKEEFLVVCSDKHLMLKSLDAYKTNTLPFMWQESLYGHTRKNIKQLSAGYKTVFLALSICKEVNLFGFGPDQRGLHGYYYNDYEFFDWEPHAPTEQDLVFKRLEEQGLVNVYMGNAEK
jgi:hypothetical protein